MKFFVSLFLILSSLTLKSQIDSMQQSLIVATIEFRNAVLENSPNYQDFEELKSRWGVIEKNDEIVDFLLFNIAYGIVIYNSNLKRIKKFAKKSHENSKLPNLLDENDLSIIRDNGDLILLIGDEFLNNKSPYNITLDSINVKELNFINIKPNETIADIGSGTGNMILITSLMYPENNFILNENDLFLVKYLQNKVERNKNALLKKNRFIEVVKGKNKSLNLGKKVDRIIVRNSFHHFSKKEDMLTSIVDHLVPGGKVVFIEHLQSNTKSIDNCEDKMTEEDVLSYLYNSSLNIDHKEVYDNTLYLSCSIDSQK